MSTAENVEVHTDQVERARRGLEAAVERWYLVDHTGREWDDGDRMDEALASSRDPEAWTTPYVSAVERIDGGLAVWVDLEGGMLSPRAQVGYLRILLDELRAAGVTRAHVRRPTLDGR